MTLYWGPQDQGTGTGTRMVGVPLCPDALTYRDLGAADTVRGHIVRAFFWLLRWLA